jgi:hypothetical protein
VAVGDKRNETFLKAGSYYYQMTAKRPLKSLMIMEDLKNERKWNRPELLSEQCISE